MERLQKAIATSGYCSRRKAEELIKQGKVKVNNNTIYEMGFKVNPNDFISVEGHDLTKEAKEYILLNKPRGVVTTTSDDKGRKTVLDIIKNEKRLYPVGRLDYDTTGVLLLTNDGELTNKLIHPKNKIDKVYIAKLKGIIDGENIHKLEKGITVDNQKYSPCKVKRRKFDKKTNTCIVEVTIHEGHNHQVKNMFESVGYEVLKLKRERFAFLTTDGLKSGEYRPLTIKEVKKLYGDTN